MKKIEKPNNKIDSKPVFFKFPTGSRHLNFHLLMTSTFGIQPTEPPTKTNQSTNPKPNNNEPK